MLLKVLNNIKQKMKFIDIGANLSDSMYEGVYGRSTKHPADLNHVLDRAWAMGMDKIILTVGTVKEAPAALKIANADDRIFITMGCHPTRCGEFTPNPDAYFAEICKGIEKNRSKVVALGELGLDYDRLHFCDAETQRIYFEKQLELAAKYNLPLFLHCRNSYDDFMKICQTNRSKITSGGVVHSFDGTLEQAREFIEFGFYIGINGCSLKTDENLKIVKEIPNDKLMIETDCPWCSIRPTHAGSSLVKTKFPTVKKKEKWTKDSLVDGRNEPANIIQVLEIIAGIKGESIDELSEQFYKNTLALFFNKN